MHGVYGDLPLQFEEYVYFVGGVLEGVAFGDV